MRIRTILSLLIWAASTSACAARSIGQVHHNATARPMSTFRQREKLAGIASDYKVNMVASTRRGKFADINGTLVEEGQYINDNTKLLEVHNDYILISDHNAIVTLDVADNEASYTE